MQAKVVDLFCGIGGLTKGLQNVGFNVVAGFDFDPTCRYAYEQNNDSQFLERDINKVTADEVNSFYGDAELKILVGCAPCQPFSMMRKKYGEESNQNHKSHDLLLQFGRLIDETLPDIVSMENVPSMAKSKLLPEFISILKKHGYSIDQKVVYCPDYNIPQNRRRFVLVASRLGEIKIIKPTHDKKKVKIRDFIYNLPPVKSGEICLKDPMHRTAKLNPTNIKRIQASKPSGTWRDWSPDLLLDCHKKESGQTFTSVYGRLHWDKIGSTMTTQFYCYGTGRYGHPEQDRALTLREGALLQTFPIDYKFIDPSRNFSIKDIARHIGNAVPVRLGEVIGESIKEHIDSVKQGEVR